MNDTTIHENSVVINIATDFTKTPGARYYSDGPYSGQQFREEKLKEYFKDPDDERVVTVDLDGVKGYAPSFLEESFGGLVRRYGRDRVKRKIKIITSKFHFFKAKAEQYIEDAKEFSEKPE